MGFSLWPPKDNVLRESEIQNLNTSLIFSGAEHSPVWNSLSLSFVFESHGVCNHASKEGEECQRQTNLPVISHSL